MIKHRIYIGYFVLSYSGTKFDGFNLKNKRPDSLASSAVILTLNPEIGPLGHIIEIQLKIPPVSIWNENDAKPVETISENDWKDLKYDLFWGPNGPEIRPLGPIFNTLLKVAQIDM